MGWPDDTVDLRIFYPTDVLITGFDIVFFWVARMIMFGLRFTGEAPFRQVFLNGLVRDEHGQKLSKTKGNVIAPLDVIDEFGSDAVRFTLAIFASGRDIPLAKSRMQGYAAFANKIWNASRFAMVHIDPTVAAAKAIDRDELKSVERWILSRLNETTRTVNRALSDFRYDEASNAIYQFFWHEFCDWYIEMVKPVLLGKHGSEGDQQNARRVLLETLDRSLRLLHPFMPFITEEIWQTLGGVEPSIMVAPYPIAEEVLEDPEAERMMSVVQSIITTVRNVRAERGFPPKEPFRLFVQTGSEREATFFTDHAYLLLQLARVSEVVINQQAPAAAHHDAIGGFPIAIELPERTVTAKQLERTQ